MPTSKIEVNSDLLAKLLFPGILVEIVSVEGIPGEGIVTLNVQGPDVPDAAKVTAVITKTAKLVAVDASPPAD